MIRRNLSTITVLSKSVTPPPALGISTCEWNLESALDKSPSTRGERGVRCPAIGRERFYLIRARLPGAREIVNRGLELRTRAPISTSLSDVESDVRKLTELNQRPAP